MPPYTNKRRLFSISGQWSQALSGSDRGLRPHPVRLLQSQTYSTHGLPRDKGDSQYSPEDAHGIYTDNSPNNRPVPAQPTDIWGWHLHHTPKNRWNGWETYHGIRQRSCHSGTILPVYCASILPSRTTSMERGVAAPLNSTSVSAL